MAITEISVSKIYVLATEPTNKVKDRFWFDTTNNLLKRYDGTTWKPISVSSDDVVVLSSGNKISLTNYLNTQIAALAEGIDSKQDKLKYYSEGNSYPSAVIGDTSAAINFNAPDLSMFAIGNITINSDTGLIIDTTVSGSAISTSLPSSIDAASDNKLPSEKAVATAISGKADKATTLAGYNISDAYTKTEVDTELGKKQNKLETYFEEVTEYDSKATIGAYEVKTNAAYVSITGGDDVTIDGGSVTIDSSSDVVINGLVSGTAISTSIPSSIDVASDNKLLSEKAVTTSLSNKQDKLTTYKELSSEYYDKQVRIDAGGGIYINGGEVGTIFENQFQVKAQAGIIDLDGDHTNLKGNQFNITANEFCLSANSLSGSSTIVSAISSTARDNKIPTEKAVADAISTKQNKLNFYSEVPGDTPSATISVSNIKLNGKVAEGNGTTASGNYSHAEGFGTTASGNYSHAEGLRTTASSNYQHVQGKYNIEDTENKYAFIIGNGTDDENRSNALTVDWNGGVKFNSDISGVDNPIHIDINEDNQNQPNVLQAKGWFIQGWSLLESATRKYKLWLGKEQKQFGDITNGEPVSWTKPNLGTLAKDDVLTIYNDRHWLNKLIVEAVNSDGTVQVKDISVAYDGSTALPPSGNANFLNFRYGLFVSGKYSNNVVSLNTTKLNIGEAELTFNSFSFGNSNTTTGLNSVSFGRSNTVLGQHSIAVGVGNKALLFSSAAFGDRNRAGGENSFAAGMQNGVDGWYSSALGKGNGVYGDASFATGIGNQIGSNYQTVIGKYNKSDWDNKYAFIIGNGTADAASNRSNALTVDWNGISWSRTDVRAGGTGQDAATHSLAAKQNSTDTSLNTTDKTIVGAINELLASINANAITSTEQKRITTTSTASGIQMSTTAKACMVSINPVKTNVGAIYISTSSDTAPTINPLYPDQMPKYKFPDASQVYIWSDVNGDSVDLTIEYYG